MLPSNSAKSAQKNLTRKKIIIGLAERTSLLLAVKCGGAGEKKVKISLDVSLESM